MTYVVYLKCIVKILQNSQYIEKSKFNNFYYGNKVNEIFINDANVYRDLSKNKKILKNYSPTTVHDTQLGSTMTK